VTNMNTVEIIDQKLDKMSDSVEFIRHKIKSSVELYESAGLHWDFKMLEEYAAKGIILTSRFKELQNLRFELLRAQELRLDIVSEAEA